MSAPKFTPLERTGRRGLGSHQYAGWHEFRAPGSRYSMALVREERHAALLAASSEMYEALRECANMLSREAENYRDDDEDGNGTYQPHGLEMIALADKARAAIGKAGGA